MREPIKRFPKWRWATVFLVLLALSLLVQMPLQWLVKKAAPNQQLLRQIEGNLWHGKANVNAVTGKGLLQGDLAWQVRPLDFFWLGVGADVQFTQGATRIEGRLFTRGKKHIALSQLEGKVHSSLLNQLMPSIQWPESEIEMHDVAFKWNQSPKKLYGFVGKMRWSGGDIAVPLNGVSQKMRAPTLNAELSNQEAASQIAISDGSGNKMAHMNIDQQGVLEAKVTQRMMLLIPNYTGQAGMDTFVVTSKQPLWSAEGGTP